MFQIEEAQSGAEKTSRQNAERLKRREVLIMRKETLEPETISFESEIKKVNGVIEELQRNVLFIDFLYFLQYLVFSFDVLFHFLYQKSKKYKNNPKKL